MKQLGFFLTIVSIVVMIFGMNLIKKINFDNILNHLEYKTSYIYINEQIASNIIYIGGPAVLLIGVFCIALDYSLDKK